MSLALLLQMLGIVLIIVAAFVAEIRGVNPGWLGLGLFLIGSVLGGGAF